MLLLGKCVSKNLVNFYCMKEMYCVLSVGDQRINLGLIFWNLQFKRKEIYESCIEGYSMLSVSLFKMVCKWEGIVKIRERENIYGKILKSV